MGAKRILQWAACTAAGLLSLYLLWLPYVPRLRDSNPKTSALIERRKRQAASRKKAFKPRMVWKGLGQVSPNLAHAVLLAEDDTFYRHSGFDFEQIWIAVKINWKKKRYAYGGSTLTQQLARTLYLSPAKSLLRKLKEAGIAFWMERALSKRRILELYLNLAEWGDGVFGAEAAARHYYGKPAAELTAEEAVALASILPSPRKWSPHRVTPFMARRRAGLLARMARDGYGPSPGDQEAEKLDLSNELLQEVPEDSGSAAP